jgi:hypothetical protein
MEEKAIRDLIYQELPKLLREDVAVRQYVLQLTQERYADRQQTESRFDIILDELRRDRELSEARFRVAQAESEEFRAWWRETQAQWKANEARWQENEAKWQENQAEIRQMREESQAKWQENQAEIRQMREESQAKWQENQAEIRQMLAEIKRLDKKHDSTIGALGSRWGLHSEASFRNGLRAILQDSFGVEVLRVNEFDSAGEVFGRPEQIELDLIVQNGTLIIAEIKSSMSKSDLYAFWRKAAFYERLHQRQAARKMVISPMVDPLAEQSAQKLGIEVYTYVGDVSLDLPHDSSD